MEIILNKSFNIKEHTLHFAAVQFGCCLSARPLKSQCTLRRKIGIQGEAVQYSKEQTGFGIEKFGV